MLRTPFRFALLRRQIARRHHSTQQTVYTPAARKRVADTDVGKTLTERIADMQRLLQAYRSGAIKEHSR